MIPASVPAVADPVPVERILEEAARTRERLVPEPSPLADLLREYVTEPLLDLLGWILRFAGGLTGSWMGWVVLASAVLGAAALLVWLGILLFRGRQGGIRRRAADRVSRTALAVADPDAADAEAARLAAAGEFVEAIRLLYLAGFSRLHRRRGLALDPSLTPGENLRPFRREPWFGPLREFVRGYQGASFGGGPLDHDEYLRLAALRPPEAAA